MAKVLEVPRVFAATKRGRPGHRPGGRTGGRQATAGRRSKIEPTVTVGPMTGGRSSAVRGRTGGTAEGVGVREPRVFPEQRRRRRRDDEPRPHRMNLRLGDDEKAAIEAAATLARKTPTSYAADVAVAVAMGSLTPIPTTYREELRELVDARLALTRIGTNLNQIARVVNSGGDVTQEQLDAVLARVGEAVRRVDEATLVNMRRRRPGTPPR
ncbi:MobC family plasmid mobilization relaxosome protein [Streptomyces griseorubiginosus]|uniref:MobC family plasmid mobilization relaxosome protein n=1 Tax=Streptomyces griseorubiginosus TaxID=67304 RepID=UPI0036E165DD